MAAPEYVPEPPAERVRVPWESPPRIPDSWVLDRPAEVAVARQPAGPRLGYQGPDQGYALRLVDSFQGRIHTSAHEHEADAVTGCVLIATRRASLFGRAPIVHDLTIAFTMWGYLDKAPSADLLATRTALFEGAAHDYETTRRLVDRVPEATLRMTPHQVFDAYPARWRELTGSTT
jgi:hypothetical protein